jgi:hypothetical protein
MRRKLRVIVGIAAVLLILPLLFSCLGNWGEPFAATGVRLVVEPSGRSVVVTDFDVTSVLIQVNDPSGWQVVEFEWFPDQGRVEELVPLSADGGEHEIVVTHFGFRDGEDVSMEERGYFHVRPMVINVISVVPGMIGVVGVDPGEGGGGGATGPSDPPILDPRLFGAWEGWVSQYDPATGGTIDVYSRMTFGDDAYAEFTGPGGVLVEDSSLSGWYECDGTNVWGEWTAMWYYETWNDMYPVMPWGGTIAFDVDSFTVDVDYDGDTVPDMSITLYRVP